MENTIWYNNLDYSMIWTCIGASLILLLCLKVYGEKQVMKGAAAEKIRQTAYIKWIYHIGSGLLLLTIVDEIGVPVFDFLIQKATALFGFSTNFSIESSEDIAHLLALICGLLGGWIIAKIVRYAQNKFMKD